MYAKIVEDRKMKPKTRFEIMKRPTNSQMNFHFRMFINCEKSGYNKEVSAFQLRQLLGNPKANILFIRAYNGKGDRYTHKYKNGVVVRFVAK